MKRYNTEYVSGGCMEQSDDGEWVKWEDVEKLESIKLTPGQKLSILHSNIKTDQESMVCNKEMWIGILNYFKICFTYHDNTPRMFWMRYYKVLRYRFFYNYTLEETGIKLNITRERVRQIELKAFRKLKHIKAIRYLGL